MKRHLISTTVGAIFITAAASSAALAAGEAPAAKPAGGMSGMSDMSKHHPMAQGTKGAEGGMGGMSGMGDMMGMMKMMNSCQSMMDGAKASSGAQMPKLPAGNEKLEFQMHAEMMQKMGQIAAQYADRIKEAK